MRALLDSARNMACNEKSEMDDVMKKCMLFCVLVDDLYVCVSLALRSSLFFFCGFEVESCMYVWMDGCSRIDTIGLRVYLLVWLAGWLSECIRCCP
jgi:hypothetical protein